MTEQEQYGTTQTAEPIPVPHDRPFVTSTSDPTAAPDPTAMQAYNAIVRKDLMARHGQNGGSDEGIVPLVLALNDLEGVMTLDSCQGEDGELAHVYFCHHGDPLTAASFVADLVATLAPHGEAADYTLTARWRPGTDEPVFQLVCPAAQSAALADVIRASVSEGPPDEINDFR